MSAAPLGHSEPAHQCPAATTAQPASQIRISYRQRAAAALERTWRGMKSGCSIRTQSAATSTLQRTWHARAECRDQHAARTLQRAWRRYAAKRVEFLQLCKASVTLQVRR